MEFDPNASGAASPDDLPEGVKEHPFAQFMPDSAPEPRAIGEGSAEPPPPPRVEDEMDTSGFDTDLALSRLFAVPMPEEQEGEEEEEKPPRAAASAAPSEPSEPAATQEPAQEPAQDTSAIIEGLNEEESALVTQYRSGVLKKELTVLAEFKKNPVAFVDKFAPELRAAVVERAAADMLTPDQFAVQYADAKLAEKYGDEFDFNPADVAIRGTASEQFFTDKQLLLAEGARKYNEITYQKQSEQQAERARIEQVARDVLVAEGFEAAQYDEVIRIAESLPASPETYYRMLYTFLRAEGRITPKAGTTGAGAQSRAPMAKPTSSIKTGFPPSANIPGKNGTARNAEAENLLDLFGVELML